MSVWTAIRDFFAGFGGSAATGGVLPTVKAGAEAVHAVSDGIREGNRNATERAIAAEQAKNEAAIEQAIKKATSNGAALALAFVLAGFCMAGCASAPFRDYCPPTGNVGRLMDAQGFKEAAVASPKWTQDALKTVNALEADNQRLRAKANQVP